MLSYNLFREQRTQTSIEQFLHICQKKSKGLGQYTPNLRSTYLQEITHVPIAFLTAPSSRSLLPDMAVTLMVVPHALHTIMQFLIPNIRSYLSSTAITKLIYVPSLCNF